MSPIGARLGAIDPRPTQLETRRSGGPARGGMTMTYKPYTAHTNETGGGCLGRILLIAELESLAPALLRKCLRDLLASIVPVSYAPGALLNYLDPAVVG